MGPFHHLAHFLSFEPFVKVGAKVERGQVIGRMGKSGTTYSHTHFEILRVKPSSWRQYTRGMTKAQVAAAYINPALYIDREAQIPARYETYGGYEYLNQILGTPWYHPGVDINWGSGNQDLGSLVKSPCKGVFAYVGIAEGTWGDHLWIEEQAESDDTFGKQHAGKIFLAVEQRGRLYWISPDGKKNDLGANPGEVMEKLASLAHGISDNDLNKINNA